MTSIRQVTLPAWATGLVLLLCLPLSDRVVGQPDTPPSAKAPDTTAAPPEGEKPSAEEEPVYIENADLVQYDPEKGIYTLTGNVHFRQEDAHLYCDTAEYNEEQDTARATGHLKLVNPESTATGDLIAADFSEKVADITGNVRLETQRKKKEAPPEPAVGEAQPTEGAAPPLPSVPAEGAPTEEKPRKLDEYREKLTVVTCERIRYWYDEKRAVATGNVVGVQEDRTVYADEGIYIDNDSEETLTLTGNPVRLVMKNGNHMETPGVKIDLTTDRLWTIGGPASGVFKREKKEEEKPAEQPPAEPPAPTPPAQP